MANLKLVSKGLKVRLPVVLNAEVPPEPPQNCLPNSRSMFPEAEPLEVAPMFTELLANRSRYIELVPRIVIEPELATMSVLFSSIE